VDEMETPHDDGRLNLHDESGMTRRDLMKRGAVVGGTLLWVAPAIQSFGSKAYAQEQGSPLCDACVSTSFNPPGPPPPQTVHVILTPTEECCDCIDQRGGSIGAVLGCAASGFCEASGVQQGSCP
jgi:hypothetical protein